MQKTSKVYKQRETLRKQLWPDEDAIWTAGEQEKGWFKALRTLPLILGVLDSKEISGSKKPSLVYLELLSRHMDNGIVEMNHEADHAFAAGYFTNRGLRTWKERMEILENAGFIKSLGSGCRKYKHVLLIHPDVAFQRLHEEEKVSPDVWNAYRERQIKSGAVPYRKRGARPGKDKVIPIKRGRRESATRSAAASTRRGR